MKDLSLFPENCCKCVTSFSVVDRISHSGDLLARHQALKFTLNSMNGCLVFEYSHFRDKPFALARIKGREILTYTHELAESLRLDVR